MGTHGIQDIGGARLDEALERGMRYLDAHHHVATEAAEREQFERYYQILLETLGVPGPHDAAVRDLVDAHFSQPEIEAFPDTVTVLNTLREKGLLLAVVSNAWPSLEWQYRMLGLREYFGLFVISAVVGCCKPDERIFRKAIEESRLPPSALLFVDDEPEYVGQAIALGMKGVVIAREQRTLPLHGLPWIANLAALEGFL
jgi:HAD superfamily hydrolase (TIGR01509 family)